MSSQNDMLQKIRTLDVQPATDTNTAEDRQALNQKMQSLADEINRVVKQNTYGVKSGIKSILCDCGNSRSVCGTNNSNYESSKMTLQVGTNTSDQINFDVGNFTFKQLAILAVNADTAGSKEGDSTNANAAAIIEYLDKMIKKQVQSKTSDI